MAKRKTRQQKIIADLKRQINASQTTSDPLVKKTEKREEAQNSTYKLPPLTLIQKKQTVSTFTNTAYLAKDLQKTLTLTAFIIAAQLVLLLILKQHVFTLGGLIY